MRKQWIVPTLLIASLFFGCATTEQKLSRTLNQEGTKVAPVVAPPTFDEPAEPLRAIYLIECPKCKSKQFLVPLRILTTGGTTVTNGNMTDRTLYFVCSKRTCKNIIATRDQVLVEPVKAVRVR